MIYTLRIRCIRCAVNGLFFIGTEGIREHSVGLGRTQGGKQENNQNANLIGFIEQFYCLFINASQTNPIYFTLINRFCTLIWIQFHRFTSNTRYKSNRATMN
ncbi:hypothetical protein Glove_34g120 [Diversispora epigaea]|uniref:Uncharacterized protein n=1 Tax=Diversispora epigaea TaxID=1348612 RepID=A0A397JJM6_9GLOM|nr:hypothetical protein Glove_34g120 [Diversispora epigaea]